MSIICKDCGGIFKKPCITFYNNTNHIYNQHFQIDNYGTLFPVYFNFLGFECWLNDTDTTFYYQPTIQLLTKLQTISQKTHIHKQIFKEITHYLNKKYITNLHHGIHLLNHQLSNNLINLQGHTLNFNNPIIPKWTQPTYLHSGYTYLPFEIPNPTYLSSGYTYLPSNLPSGYTPNLTSNLPSGYTKVNKKKSKTYLKSSFKSSLPTIPE